MDYCRHFKVEETEVQRGKFICPNQSVNGRAIRFGFIVLPPGNGITGWSGTNGYPVSY